MGTSRAREHINQDRRRLLGTAAMGIVADGAACSRHNWLRRPRTKPFALSASICRRRTSWISAGAFPKAVADRETVNDQSQGIQLAKLKPLVEYWGTGYDWRKAEAKINTLPQFMTRIDNLDIHFVHVRSHHPNALPLIMTHGWPGSVFELLKTVGPLTDPTAHGGRPEDALTWSAFDARPRLLRETDGRRLGPDRIARVWAELMKRLGYTRYVAQGGDWGAPVSSAMARLAPAGLLGIHINLPAVVPPEVTTAIAAGGPAPAGLSEKERATFDVLSASAKRGADLTLR